MELPRDISLQFFSYGIFKPGQLGHHQLREFIENCTPCSISGRLNIRDGLPLLDSEGKRMVEGWLLSFVPGRASDAYSAICKMEPGKQYYWNVRDIDGHKFNVLEGKSLKKGSEEFIDRGNWNGSKDPLFTTALKLIKDMLKENRDYKEDLIPTFRLEMAYLLLWTSIERYVSFRYNIQAYPNSKVNLLASDNNFKEVLASTTIEDRELYSAKDPDDKFVLNRNEPENAAEYYYQVRCNITHRGKAIATDHDKLVKSLDELLYIYSEIIKRSFSEDQQM